MVTEPQLTKLINAKEFPQFSGFQILFAYFENGDWVGRRGSQWIGSHDIDLDYISANEPESIRYASKTRSLMLYPKKNEIVLNNLDQGRG